MKKTLLTSLLAIGLLGIFSSAHAAASVPWARTGTTISPWYTNDSIRFPVLGGGGTLCLQTDNDGDISTTACGSGSGGGSGTWSTTTSTVLGRLINYPNNTTDIVTVGANSTTSAKVYFDPNLNHSYFGGTMVIGTTTATSSANTAYVTIERPISSLPGLRVIGGNSSNAALEVRSRDTGSLPGVIAILSDEYRQKGLTFKYASSTNTFTIFGDYYDSGPSSSLVLGTYESRTNQLVLTNNGKVGVGSTSPISMLSVQGDLHLSGSSQDISWRTGEAFQLGEYDGSTFTERFRILNTGFTGIGTTTPRSLLSIQGNALFSGNLSLANLTATGTLTLTGITGTQCLRATNGVVGGTGADCGSGGSSVSTSTITFTFDGGGASLTEASTSFAWRSIPIASTIKSWTLTGDLVGSTTIHVAKSTYANYPGYALIDGSDIPKTINAQKNTSTALTGWTTALSTGDIIYAFVSGAATTTTKMVLNIDITTP